MYCVSIGIQDFKFAMVSIQNYSMAEIRLDLCDFDRKQVKEIFRSHQNLIATFRKSNRIKEKYRISILKTAISHGAKWLDLDMENNDSELINELNDFRMGFDTKLILSVHNYKKTPDTNKIDSYITKAKEFNPDLIKLVFFSNSIDDNKQVLSLYDKYENILAFNMGKIGKTTRAISLKKGAPFTYVSLENEKTAPGQITLEEIKNIHNLNT